ncbi:MAG: outer membrane protein [Bosea sp. (in: a-proteobacteria)]
MKMILAAMICGFVAMTPGAVSAQDAWRNSTVIIPDRFTWSGVYAGAQGGFAQVNATGTLVGAGSLTAKPAGGFGGGHIGLNYQIEHLVFGVEADIEASGIRRKYIFGSDTGVLSSDWIGSVRARFGMAYDRLLFYGTVGLGVADGTARIDAPSVSGTARYGETFYGHTFGFGIEYAFSRNFSMRAEWRTTNFQPRTYTLLAPGDARLELESQAIRVGASYRF